MTLSKDFIQVDHGIYRYRLGATTKYIVVAKHLEGLSISIAFEYVTDGGEHAVPFIVNTQGVLTFLAESFDKFYEDNDDRYQWLLFLLSCDHGYSFWDELRLIMAIDTLMLEKVNPDDLNAVKRICAGVSTTWESLELKAKASKGF